MEGSSSQRSFSDCLEVLKALDDGQAQALIVGGQAVNFWAELFQEEEPELARFRPFVSSDLDLNRPSISARTVLRAKATHIEGERDPFGKAFTIVSQTFLVQDAEGRLLAIDELKMVPGLRTVEVERGGVVVAFKGVTVRVLNPICSLKAKLHNLRNLDQRDRQDLKHANILILCVRAFLRRLLVEAKANANYRPALNALRDVLLCTSRTRVVETARRHGIDLTRCLPASEISASTDPRIGRFCRYQLPKWQIMQKGGAE